MMEMGLNERHKSQNNNTTNEATYIDLPLKKDKVHKQELPVSVASVCAGELKCEHCPKIFSGQTAKRNLVLHIQRHKGVDRKYCCDVCEKKFIQRSHLAEHRYCHTNEKPHKCHKCDKAFRSKANLSRHKKRHVKLEDEHPLYLCDMCETDFTNLDQLKHHVCFPSTDKNNIKVKDTVGPILVVNEERKLKSHCLDLHVPSDETNRLDHLLNDDNTLISENNQVGVNHDKVLTTRSGKVYDSQLSVAKVFSSEPPKKLCTTATSKYNVKKNMKTLKEENCVVKTNSTQKLHENKRDEPTNDLSSDDGNEKLSLSKDCNVPLTKRLLCSICNEEFASMHSLKLHKSQHISESPYKCHYCQLSFALKASCVKHEKIHTRSEVHKPFVCDVCNKTFSKKDNMIEHRFCHTGEKPFSCNMCNFRFRSKSNLRRHKVAHGSQMYQCPICNVGFMSEMKLRYHMRVHGIYNKFQIPQVLENMRAKSVLDEKHQSEDSTCMATEESAIECTSVSSTGKQTESERSGASFPIDEKDELDMNNKMNILSAACSYKGLMNVHIGNDGLYLNVLGHKNESKIKLGQTTDISEVVSSDNLSLQGHELPISDGNKPQLVNITVSGKKIVIDLDSQDEDEGRLLSPTETTSTFELEIDNGFTAENNNVHLVESNNVHLVENTDIATQTHMTDHKNYCESKDNDKTSSSTGKTKNSRNKSWKDVTVRKKNNEIYFVCNKCGISCLDCPSMRDHLQSKIHHKFPCNMCNNSYSTKVGLLRHIRTHTGERPYQCEICGKAFVCAEGLRNHKITHSSVKPHQCNVCHRGFTNTGALYEHARIHSGEKIHQCETCGISFTHRQSLKRHITKHTGVRPFKCKHCTKSFIDTFSLKRHLISHTGERPHKCGICGKSYMSVSHLSRHTKSSKKCKKGNDNSGQDSAESETQNPASSPITELSPSFVFVDSPVEHVVIISDGKLKDSPGGNYLKCRYDSNGKTLTQTSENNLEKTCEKHLIVGNVFPESGTFGVNQCYDNTSLCDEKTFTVNAESTDRIYQCESCLRTFIKFEEAVNHVCTEIK